MSSESDSYLDRVQELEGRILLLARLNPSVKVTQEEALKSLRVAQNLRTVSYEDFLKATLELSEKSLREEIDKLRKTQIALWSNLVRMVALTEDSNQVSWARTKAVELINFLKGIPEDESSTD